MSPVQYLQSLIAKAQDGDEAATEQLRSICAGACEKAPMSALISIATLMVQIGVEATREQIERN